jgi:very-short-patch-repair endonuclease
VNFGTTRGVIERLEAAAAQEWALVTWRAARSAGLTHGVVARLCATGRWRRVAHGVYAVTALDGGPFQQAAADLLVAGDRSFLEIRTAAALHGGLDLDWDGSVDIAVLPNGNGRHRRRSVLPERLTVVHGLRCTDPLQTVLDLAGELTDVEWEWALEASLRAPHRGTGSRGARRPLTTIGAVESASRCLGGRDRAARELIERVLSLRPEGAPPTESLLETMFVQLARRAGAPTPDRQVEVTTHGGTVYRVDLAWPGLGVFLELDGEHHKGQPVYDARRQTAIVATTGWLCGRFTWTEVTRNPTPTMRTLLALLEEGRRRVS